MAHKSREGGKRSAFFYRVNTENMTVETDLRSDFGMVYSKA